MVKILRDIVNSQKCSPLFCFLGRENIFVSSCDLGEQLSELWNCSVCTYWEVWQNFNGHWEIGCMLRTTFLTSNGDLLTDDQKVAEELNSYFVSIFTSDVDSGKLSVVKDPIINCLIQILSLWWNTPQNTAGTCSSYYLWGTLEIWGDGRSLEKHKYVFLSKKTKKVIFLNYCPVSLTTKLRKML